MDVVLWRPSGSKTKITGLNSKQATTAFHLHSDMLNKPHTQYYRVTVHSDGDRVVLDSDTFALGI